MKPYYDEGGITIYHGDALETLSRLSDADQRVGIVLTSPPWNVGLQYEVYEDDLPEQDFKERMQTWLYWTHGMATEGARAYVVVSDAMLFWFRGLAEREGWKWAQLLVWCKPNFAVHGRISGDWNNMTEWILLFRKGKRTPMVSSPIQATTHNWFTIPTPQRNFYKDQKLHVAQWPIELPMRILSRTPGDVVLDPFMGSGTTLRAAKDLGRKAIGIEIVEEYCEIAARRLAQGVLF